MKCTILEYMNTLAFSQMGDDLSVLKIIITRMSKRNFTRDLIFWNNPLHEPKGLIKLKINKN